MAAENEHMMAIRNEPLYHPETLFTSPHRGPQTSDFRADQFSGTHSYHYEFLFARNAGHCDGALKRQTLSEALEYVWQGYPDLP